MNKVIAVAAGAVAIVTGGAVAGCSSTTTVKEVPVAAAPTTATATPATSATSAPAATKTVTAPATSAPAAPAAPAAGLSYCGSPADQGGISVNSHTSCPFAENVESAWESSGGASSVTAYSPVTGLTYTLSCTASGTGYEVCSSGGNYIEFAAAPASAPGPFADLSTLSQSVTSEQQASLAAAPADDYDSADDAPVTVTLTPLGGDTYSATATDTDGDTGAGDTITVSPDGSSWSDTGMSWSGPDVAAGSWATPAVSGYS